MSGAWVGTASDSTGSMMGAGMGGSPSWAIVQNGSAFSGTMTLPGHMGGQMTVSGVMNGLDGTFTMSMPPGSMMNGGCAATASGTFTLNEMMTQLQATYRGSGSCTGTFDHGVMSMHR